MELKSLKGQHHVSAITKDAKKNYEFYTQTLGMRLVKKTVNQDETSMYHLFYADERGNPGTDLTFFEIPMAGRTYPGTNSISLTTLRVPGNESLQFWKKHFDKLNVTHDDIVELNGRKALPFRDFEDQRLALISDEHNSGVPGGKPWRGSPIPVKHAIIGLGPVMLTVSDINPTRKVFTELLGFRDSGKYRMPGSDHEVIVFETGDGGNGAEVHLIERPDLPRERPGRGSVHHVAFRVDNEVELQKWVSLLKEKRIPNTGFVERFYFRSLYFREPNGILFELATDGPGFEEDEDFEHLGETLALPPYFEDQRDAIETSLKPLDTKLNNY
ncbi:ring-cleaving dioxygenase [Mesobacillus maritimus]|uniref:ring-cleaving dioxygenase n=1 Tax=Mesobacillus maritimus TaxID=1643336 RepID=UPI002041141B|nr:ring-cleaving dioxygenase [Mesobacillus maritimus]MCM3584132.1 ring-cleaving dioxygenase [Mesobacillus maritimus]MCM3669406.1 ring-cleaving dioxygenase [Mesobacillus maritimus]